MLVLCLAEAGVLTHHDVKPAGTFRTTDLIVDPYDLACHAPGIGNPKRL